MSASDRYAMLVTSLPAHAPIFTARQTPLSRIRLDERLGMLSSDDAAQLDLVESALQWGRISHVDSDEEIHVLATAIMKELDSPFLREIVRDRLELRTVVAALRRRRLGEAAPQEHVRWGFGRWLGQIRRRWTDPTFGLDRAFPWMPEASRLLESGRWLELEKALLSQVWDDLGRRGEGHYFDFEAVVIYVLRWSLVDRWTSNDAEQASNRFKQLIDGAIAERLDEVLGSRATVLN